MKLTREWRFSVALALAILAGVAMLVWGSQRQAQAATLAQQIICYVDQQLGPDVPFNPQTDYCNSGTPTEPEPTPQCFDGIDNDSDGKIDWGVAGDPDRDPGCDTPTDSDETDTPPPPPPPPAPQCQDALDNDTDGLIDFPLDPGCADAADNDETDTPPPPPQCSDAADNDQDGKTDYPADPGCTDANDTDEADPQGGGGGSNDDDGDSSGGSPHRRSSRGSSSNTSGGEVLGVQTECPMYLMGYIRRGADNDAGEVARLQVFLNAYEANALAVTGAYDTPTLAAVNAFQNKYASDVLIPWGLAGPTGYVYYTTQRQINTIYCKFQKDFPLSAAQTEEIAYFRAIQPQPKVNKAQSSDGTGAAPRRAAASSTPAVGQTVPPRVQPDENALGGSGDAPQTAAAASASPASTPGWFGKFVNWLFGR